MNFIDRKGRVREKLENREVKNRISVYGLLIKEGKILMVNPIWNDFWELPGGGKNENETVEECLRREFQEETNIEISQSKKVSQTISVKFYADDIDEYFNSKLLFFDITKTENTNIKILDKKEIKKLEWKNISELNKKNTNNNHLEIITNFSRK
jgi:8-oxo-dGTP diphosphatase